MLPCGKWRLPGIQDPCTTKKCHLILLVHCWNPGRNKTQLLSQDPIGFFCGRDLLIQKTTQNWVGLNGRLLKFAHSPDVPSRELAAYFHLWKRKIMIQYYFFRWISCFPGVSISSLHFHHSQPTPPNRFFCWRLQHDFLMQSCCFYGGAVPKPECFQNVPRVGCFEERWDLYVQTGSWSCHKMSIIPFLVLFMNQHILYSTITMARSCWAKLFEQFHEFPEFMKKINYDYNQLKQGPSCMEGLLPRFSQTKTLVNLNWINLS